MLVEKIVGNLASYPLASHQTIEWIELDWEQLRKRILRVATDRGTDVAIRLAGEQRLAYEDILYADDDKVIVVRTKEEEVIVIYPQDMIEMGKVAFELGNRHTPALVAADEIIVRADHTLFELLDEVGVRYEEAQRRFKEPFKYRGHTH